MNEAEAELAVRAAWLSYIGGYTQEEIAQRLGVSRIKVHRLITAANETGLIKVSIEHDLAACVVLEERLVQRYGLSFCAVTPTLKDSDSNIRALGVAGGRFLTRHLEQTDPVSIGVGWGRTLAAVAAQVPMMARPMHRFVSLLGSLTRRASTNPFDVVHRLADRTGGEGFFMPVPFIADTAADKEVLLSQNSVRDILSLARQVNLCLVGIGEIGRDAPMLKDGLLTGQEAAELEAAGAAGNLIGKFFDAQGRLLDCEVNERTLGLDLADLADHSVVAVAGGAEKFEAIRAVLRSRILSGLITDEEIAKRLLGDAGVDSHREAESAEALSLKMANNR